MRGRTTMEKWDLEASSQRVSAWGALTPAPHLAWSYRFSKGARTAVNSR